MSVFTRTFWKDTFERVIVTAAQAGLVVLTMDGFDIIDQAGWVEFLSAAGLGAVAAFLKALVASRVGNGDSASLDPNLEVQLTPHV